MRTTAEIITSLGKTIESLDDSLDVTKGPIYNFVMAPVAPEISSLEKKAERLERLMSLDMVNADDNTDDINAFGNNYKVPRGGGTKERHMQTFYLYTKPSEEIEIPTGGLVGTEQGTYVYKVLEGRNFVPENAANYYNSTTGRYEINLMVEAVDYGSDYNLPKGRVNKVISTISVDGTVSATASLVEGTDEETDAEYLDKTEKRFEGLNSGSDSGIISMIDDSIGISDVATFKPGDDLFTRKVMRAALDIYVNGSNEACETQTLTTDEATTRIKLEVSPATRVDTVLVNDEAVSFQFVQDTSEEVGGSDRSEDYVVFDSEIEAGSYVSITYYVNNDVVQAAGLFSESDLFESDVMVRYPFTKYLNLEILIKINSTDKEAAQEQAEEAVADYPAYTMGETLNPLDIESQCRTAVANVVSVHVLKHNLDGQPFGIGVVQLPANSIVSTENAVIKVV